ncbi:hypothetical protein SteCoe_13572 [Stentor coeruleus]|uniref:Serine/threonine protein phosphatase 2A regulatory subunit n=1 Tax=Stentor coeruleus TaxID=5963 RepID=A0A1R2C843_9CILI|nr:hypothetical protein SteCoe_13572 [Stentor coeruleus]
MIESMSFKHGAAADDRKIMEVNKVASVVQIIDKANAEPKNSIEVKELFLKRIQICSVTYDYSDDTKNTKAKSKRLIALKKLKVYLYDIKSVESYILPHLDAIFEMVSKNIFRPLPIDKKSADKLGPLETGVENQDIIIDPAWPHLQGIYEFFLELVICEVDGVKWIMIYITPSFTQEFLELFNSEEPRERDYLKNILHKIYRRLVPKRKMIRNAINNCFLIMIHDNQKFNGAGELLDILGFIINGFAVPLREEHIIFFKNILIPLHKVQTSHLFQKQLLECSMKFISKNNDLSIFLIEGLLRYWPFCNSLKEIFFLTELNDVIEVCEMSKLENLIPKLFKRLIKCMLGSQLQVSERVMQFFENDYFLGILRTFKQIIFPMIVPIIIDLAETHWHKILLESFNGLKIILKEIDPVAFDRALQGPKGIIKDDSLNVRHNIAERSEIEAQWEALTKKAQTIDLNFIPPAIPYTKHHVVGLHNMNKTRLSSNNLIPPV